MNKEALLCIESFGGYEERPCRVVRETPKRYEVMVDKPTVIPPGFNILLPGMKAFVPKTAVKFKNGI